MLKEKIEASKKIQRNKVIDRKYEGIMLFIGFIERQKQEEHTLSIYQV
jgi:hypothetical protein